MVRASSNGNGSQGTSIPKDELPECLRPYAFLGVDFNFRKGDREATANCPWCGRDSKFRTNISTGLWQCVVCKAGTERGGGGIGTFLQLLWERSFEATQPVHYEELAEDRNLASAETLVTFHLAVSILTDKWLIPGFNVEGKLTGLYQYVKSDGRMMLMPTPTLKHHLLGRNTYDETKPKLYLCYSDDTEILTDDGWKLFSELEPTSKVAAYNKDSREINFEIPQKKQKIKYNGNMVHFKSEWSELLTTPDHRMLCITSSKPRVLSAGELGAQVKLPVSGIGPEGCSGLNECQVRLLAAFVADGCLRGSQIEFGFKKDRKKARLRYLLEEAGIKYKELVYPKSPDCTSFLIYHRDAPFFALHCPAKTWTGAEIYWETDLRKVLLNELQHWDGDASKNSVRYFTSKKSESDIISRVAVLTGYGCHVESKKEDTEFVVNLIQKEWRQLSKKPEIVPGYSGYVYCVTTSTGFVVVRRKGKTVIAGNCEGLWDMVALYEALSKSKLVDGHLAMTGNDVNSLIADANVLAIPTATVFYKEWLPLFDGKEVMLAGQNDWPRETDGGIAPGASYVGMRRIASMIANSCDTSAPIQWFNWGEDCGHNPHLKSGYDIRDSITEPAS